MKKKLIIALFISMLLVMPMNNNYVDAAKSTPTKEVATTNYTIKYNLNGGTNSKSNPTKYNSKTKTIKLKNPTRSGYAFEGWYSDAKLKKKVTSIKKGSKGNVTLYAKWSRYTIKYNLNGGTNSKSNPTSYNKNTKTIKLKNPTRKGYDFLGWYKDAKLKKKVTSIKKGSKGNLTLYAKWESNADYKIAYNLNGGKNSKSNPVKYNKKTKTIKLKNPTREGYTFGGWYKDAKLKKKVTQIKKGSKGNVTLYAKWNANTYTIKFDKNGANKGKMSSQTKVKYGSSVKLNANKYTKNGYAFIGWNIKKNGKGTTYADKASVKNLVSKNKGTITLYAMWANQFTIKYNLNGGVNNKANPTKYKINTEVVLKNPTRSGYKFLGWYTDSKFKNKVTKISKNYNKNITLYAKWESTKPAYNPTAREKKALADLKEIIENSNGGEGSYISIVTMLQDEYYLFTDTEVKNALNKVSVDWSTQALKRVKSMLNEDGYGYSYNGIINNLTSEWAGFTEEQVKTALSKVTIDWSAQALKRIKNMLESDSYGYSYNRVVKDLTNEYNAFSETDVKAALSKVTADWNAQALKRVKNMLNSSGYSYARLLELLQGEYNEFTAEQAKYAVDNCKVDWNEQALRVAKDSLESTSYSYKLMLKNLQSEWAKFTPEQAKYAADNCGADWNAQALKRAKELLESSIYSKEDLLETLQEDWIGFTFEQATYAVNNCGANWNEQAQKRAKELIEHNNFSHKEVMEELQNEYYKFTAEEAKYGADNCGGNWNDNALKAIDSRLGGSAGYSNDDIKRMLVEFGFTEEQAAYAIANYVR